MNADIPGIQLQHECRYSRKLTPTWTLIFQEFSSNVNADIPDKFRNKMKFSLDMDTKFQDKDINSGVNTESQRQGYQLLLRY
uniref:Uncharacterized protein n=1 Tax=Rhizophagus irregularis (strain DAOM 181602 / DAOM 197198 / MUCL 43194) TaxID=747089 RepID=U9U972_RHIID